MAIRWDRTMTRLLFLVLLITAVLTACDSNHATKKGDEMDMNMSHEGHQSDDHAAAATGHAAGHGSDGAKDILAEDVNVKWIFAKGSKPQSGNDTLIRMEFENKGKDFDITHEQKEHLIVVSKDLSYFNHIHPEYKGHGVFEVTTKFPAGGDYKLIADFSPTGGSPMNKVEWTHVEGASAQTIPLKPETDLTQVVDGMQVTLAFDQLKAKQELMLTYTITDAKTNEPVTDLQPYLGAVGHVVILTGDAEQYLHVHPVDEKASGPQAEFMTTFPQGGVYKIWGQFQRDGKVITVPFIIKVP